MKSSATLHFDSARGMPQYDPVRGTVYLNLEDQNILSPLLIRADRSIDWAYSGWKMRKKSRQCIEPRTPSCISLVLKETN